MELLVRTPTPEDSESFGGYVLRVSEANGYDSPCHMLKYAGLRERECRGMRFPPQRLKDILGHDAARLERLSYCGPLRSGVAEFRILGQPLGNSCRHNLLRVQQPALCPHCVVEAGYLDVAWDMKLVIACSKHQCTLIEKCQTCSKRLTWFRPGLLKCRCGAGLATALTSPVKQPVADLMAVLCAKVHGKPLSTLENKSGFPLYELETVSLLTFCKMLISLALHHLSIRKWRPANLDTMKIVESAAEVLKDWPHGYHQFLHRVGTETGSVPLYTVGLNTRFKQFYTSMFKQRSYAAEYQFLRDEYVRFGCTQWGESTVDSRMSKGMDDKKRWVSRAELAKQLGINAVTAQQWAKDGLLTLKAVTTGKTTRYIADTNDVRVPRRSGGKTLGGIQAAARIGVPAVVLRKLCQSGHYQVANLASQRAAFHEKDIEQFRSQLIGRDCLRHGLRPSNQGTLTFAEVMRKIKFGSPEMKAVFVAAYLDGQLQSLGRYGDSVTDIYFDKAVVLDYARSSRLTLEKPCSYAAAAKLLQCDQKAVPGLIAQGHLVVESKTNGASRVVRTSIQAFSAEWVSLVSVARTVQTTAFRLERLADNAGLQRMTVTPTYNGASPSSFLRREDESRLRVECERLPAREH